MKALLALHLRLHPTHEPIGQSGTWDACGQCSGFTETEIARGQIAHRPVPWWRVRAQRTYPHRP